MAVISFESRLVAAGERLALADSGDFTGDIVFRLEKTHISKYIPNHFPELR